MTLITKYLIKCYKDSTQTLGGLQQYIRHAHDKIVFFSLRIQMIQRTAMKNDYWLRKGTFLSESITVNIVKITNILERLI